MKTKTPSILSAVKKIRFLLLKAEKIKLLGIAAFALCTSVFEIITATLIVIFAQVLNAPETGLNYVQKLGLEGYISPNRTVFYLAIVVGVVYLIKNIIAAAEVFYQNIMIQKICYHFKNRLLQRYAQADYAFYLTRNSSEGLHTVSGAAEQVFTGGMVALASLISEGFVFVCLVGVVIYMNPALAFSIFIIGGLMSLLMTRVMMPHFYKFGKKLQETSIAGTQNLMQFFHAFKEIILLGKIDNFVSAYAENSFKKAKVQALQTAVNALPRMVIEALFVGLFVTAIAILCLEQESPMHMIGVLGGYLYVGFRLMPGLNRMINQLNAFKAVIPSIERVKEEYEFISTNSKYENITNFTFNKSISFNDVYFRYLNTEKDVLKNITFEIKKGESIGIVGETGSGKSTLVDVILGLLKPRQGSVIIDSKYPVNSYQWHKSIGYVPQSIYLTDDTIEANIAFGEDSIDQTQLKKVIAASQLEELIKRLPEGSKTLVGERGVRLSGGERQRIAIARTLYRNPEVLIFDEATSALDTKTEKKVMETIDDLGKNHTVIMIAHRVSTLKNCDRIVSLRMGAIEKNVTYSDLVRGV